MKISLNKIYEREQFIPSVLGLFINPYYFIRRGIAREIATNAKYLKGRLLDFGCGSKPYRDIIDVEEYTGLDIEQEGHSKEDKCADIYYDGKTIPCEESYFDVVLSSEVFEHIFNLDDVMSELYRVLKPNGYLFVTLPFVWDEHEIPYDFARYTSFGIEYILEKHGYKVINMVKSGNYIEVIFQMLATYVNHLIQSMKILNRFAFIFVAPIIIIGALLSKILPLRTELYLTTIVIAQKCSNIKEIQA